MGPQEIKNSRRDRSNHDGHDFHRRPMNFNLLQDRRINPAIVPPRVTLIQWTLAGATVVLGLVTTEISSYQTLAIITQICATLSAVLLVSVTREAVRARIVGKGCLIAGVFIFYWMDAVWLTLQPVPFMIPDGFPINATQFDQDLIREGLTYVSLFQLLTLVGYSIRPRFDRPLRYLSSRIDSLSFDRSILGLSLIFCAFLPLAIYYNFDVDKIVTALIAGRAGTDFEGPEPGLAQHVATFGIYGAALFFVYALKAKTWRRLWWLLLGIVAALPFVSAGSRHMWLYIALPSLLIILRGLRTGFDTYRLFGLAAAVVVVLLVAQFQFAYRSVGWGQVGNAPVSNLSELNSNGQFTALLFAEHLVPNEHAYFREPSELYFLIHWIPRQLWPDKPIMESWTFYNDSYVQGAAFNVTPSVIGQFHMSWGLAGVIFIGAWLGLLAMFADRLLLLLDPDRQRAMFVVAGMFYAFIISSFRFYSPIYFSYFLFGLIAMFLLTRSRTFRPSFPIFPERARA
jgi:hypothetical protein